MSRRFPLEGVLRARRLAEEGAAAELERANRGRRLAEHAVDEATRQLSTLAFPTVGLSRGEMSLGTERTWQAIVASRAATAVRIADLTDTLDQATAKADKASHDWSAARTRASMVEKLGERHAAREAAEELRLEQLVLDEAALRGALKEDEL
ncbi:flagellar export protein FliJ [Demequina capsici]|uniref:Flagellar FliJ protein n=1 Tax=Demequina capsici TaxID=3075620 RepID=A0AA96J7P0_9MICO|nr:flagellar export protein FliJ [Demequina sp. OYTSA14]WNM24555.1 flagellar export protein FliJ [Demequina sp. OYTSA14]